MDKKPIKRNGDINIMSTIKAKLDEILFSEKKVKNTNSKIDYNRMCNKIILAQSLDIIPEKVNPDIEHEIYLKIDAIIDNYNFLPAYTFLLEELSNYFTFDEIFTYINQIQCYYRYMKKFDL